MRGISPGGVRAGAVLTLHMVATLCAPGTTRPLGNVMLHQNIVMTLHGLMDHVDVSAVQV